MATVGREIKVRRNKHGERWVTTSLQLEPEGSDLLYALGSRYFQNDPIEDHEHLDQRPDSLPTTLTQMQILKIYRDEFFQWGNAHLGSWADHLNETRQAYVMGWLAELVVNAFPDLEETIR